MNRTKFKNSRWSEKNIPKINEAVMSCRGKLYLLRMTNPCIWMCVCYGWFVRRCVIKHINNKSPL